MFSNGNSFAYGSGNSYGSGDAYGVIGEPQLIYPDPWRRMS